EGLRLGSGIAVGTSCRHIVGRRLGVRGGQRQQSEDVQKNSFHGQFLHLRPEGKRNRLPRRKSSSLVFGCERRLHSILEGVGIGRSKRRPYLSETRTRTNPLPDSREDIALPMTAPLARLKSLTFMAWPGVSEVVSISPASIAPFASASHQHQTRPMLA